MSTQAATANGSTPSKGLGKGAHLTPLKTPTPGNGAANAAGGGASAHSTGAHDKTLEADDTLFTEAFVKRLTPRSVEACRLLGVLPEELVLRSYENFYEHGISPNIQKLRYQDYEQMRQETLAMVREERNTLIAEGWNENISPAAKLKIQQATLKAMMLPDSPLRRNSSSRSPSPGNSPKRGLLKSASHGALASSSPDKAAQDGHSASHRVLPNLLPEELLLQMEQERLRKTMIRQNKEIESMMAYELKLAQMLAKQEAKMEARRQKEAEAAEARREERYRQAEKRRLWELQKLEEEEKMAEANRQAMARLNDQERKHMEELMRREEERKKESNRRAAERRKKKLEAELRAQQNLERQYELQRERERDMEDRDRKRREALEEKRRKLAAEHAEEKRAAMRRVQNVLDNNARALEEKREDLTKKMDEMENRLKQFEELKQQIANEKAEEIRQREERRLAALNDSKMQLDSRIHSILDKKAKHDLMKEEMESKAREQHALKMELRRLNKIRKQANVERLKRMQDYHRTALNEKLSEESRKVAELEDKKKELMAKRQQNAINMFKQKEQLMKLFSNMTQKKNWDSLSKLQVKDGKLDLSASGSSAASDRRANDRRASASPAPSGLIDALAGLNKLAKSQGKAAPSSASKTSSSIDHYLKRSSNQMQKSKSQGML